METQNNIVLSSCDWAAGLGQRGKEKLTGWYGILEGIFDRPCVVNLKGHKEQEGSLNEDTWWSPILLSPAN